jgi:hypothetical protein
VFLTKYEKLSEEDLVQIFFNDEEDNNNDLTSFYLVSQNIPLNKTSAKIPRKSSIILESFNIIVETINDIRKLSLHSVRENIKPFNELLKQINPTEDTGTKDTYFKKREIFYRNEVVQQIKSTETLRLGWNPPDASEYNNEANEENFIYNLLLVLNTNDTKIKNLDEEILKERGETYMHYNQENSKRKILNPILKNIREKETEHVAEYLTEEIKKLEQDLSGLRGDFKSKNLKPELLKLENDIINETLIILQELYNLFMTKIHFRGAVVQLNKITGFTIERLEIDKNTGNKGKKNITFKLFFDDKSTKQINFSINEKNYRNEWINVIMLELTIIKYLLCFKEDKGYMKSFYYDEKLPATDKSFYWVKLENSAIFYSLEQEYIVSNLIKIP